MQTFNACSNCSTQLQAFYVKTGDGLQLLEIDGCRKCKGLWFDSGELEKVVGKTLQLKWIDQASRRRCARCQKPMRSWNAPSGLPLEKCESCNGVFLDADELSKLGGAGAEEKARSELVARVGFQCLKCQGQFPLTQGNAMGNGLVCKKCVPQIGEEPMDKLMDKLDDHADESGPLSFIGVIFAFLDD